MKKNLIVKQDGYKECASACLLSIIRYYGGNISINKLVDLTKTDKTGTNFYNIKLAASEIGLEGIGYKVDDLNKLKTVKTPFICQVIEKNYEHFIVVYSFKKNKLEMMDPAFGKKVIELDEFEKSWTSYIMTFSPIKKLPIFKEEKYLNKIIKETILKNKGIVFNILLLSIIFTLVSFVYTFYLQLVLEDFDYLLIITFIFSLLIITKCITSFFRNQLLIYLNQKIDYTCILKTFQKVLLLPFNYYKNRTTGEIISRINDLIYVKNILNKIILTVLLDLILFVSSSIILSFLNIKMFVILVLISLIYIFILYVFKPKLKEYTNINQINQADINSFLVESISGFETIKNLNMESLFMERMEDIYVGALNDSFVYDNISNLEIFLKELVSLIGILLVTFLGLKYVSVGILTIGNVFSFLTLSNYFLNPIMNIVDLSKEYFYATNSINRVNNLFEIACEDLNDKTTYDVKGDIILKNLSFSYNGVKNILSNVGLKIKAGSKVVIVGSSGSGKSTILKLLLRYYKVNRGNIYINDVDINDFSLLNLRENIACISQNEFIYTDTIINNITMNKNVSDDELKIVKKIVHLDDFIDKMFLGYDTKLEENGVNLSGGQRQRIILARMLLQNKKIMLIDEGLNQIDINLERKILKEIFEKYCDSTIIVISHRRENLDLFEKIVNLENGSIVSIIDKKEGISI